MIAAQYLEVAVLLLGFALICVDAFTNVAKRTVALWGAIGLVAIFVGTFYVQPTAPTPDAIGFASFYVADPLALMFKRIAIATTAIVILMMIDYAPVAVAGIRGATPESGLGELYTLPLFTCAGMMWMASANDFVMIFVSLELVTISFYVLVSLTRRNLLSLEAGVKYLVLSALSTGLLIFGITWIFGATGETNLQRVAQVIASGDNHTAALLGALLVIIALGFKIAAAPFQLWVPDVYQGAPTPVTAFLSVGSKAAGIVVLLRVLAPFLAMPQTQTVLVAIAILTLIYGNLAAIPQANVKRLLAYSSIAHTGYLLVGVVSFSGTATVYYVVAYLLMTLLSFYVLVIVAQQTGETLDDFNGLSKRSPLLAFAMLVALASLAGVPFTAGFLGKFLVFDAAVAQRQIALSVIGVITVGCGFYYYFKIVRAMYWESAPSSAAAIRISPLARYTMILLTLAIFVFGVYPRPILDAMRTPTADTVSSAAK